MRKSSLYGLIAVVLLFVLVVAFFAASFILSQQHDVTIVQEWQNWFGIKDVVASTDSLSYIRCLLKI